VTAGPFVIEAPASGHDRVSFSCGVEAFDRYFRQQVTQDIRRHVTACYVAIEVAASKVEGYYTLAASGVPLSDLPVEIAKRLPRSPSIPVARVGRLAVDQAYRGQKLGGALLWDAAQRSQRSEVAVLALVVDARDDTAASFYRHHGFTASGNPQMQSIFPLTGLAARK
jgi:GNAT superfamily N-acetyltransferase